MLAGDISWVERKPRKSLIPLLNFSCMQQIQMLPLGNSYGDGIRTEVMSSKYYASLQLAQAKMILPLLSKKMN